MVFGALEMARELGDFAASDLTDDVVTIPDGIDIVRLL